MNFLNELIFFIFINLISIIIFVSFSPIIDHFFGDLDEKKTKLRIMFEIILHFALLSFLFIIYHHYFNILVSDFKSVKFIRKSDLDGLINKQIYLLVLFCFIELQHNLKKKLEYLTKQHFIRDNINI